MRIHLTKAAYRSTSQTHIGATSIRKRTRKYVCMRARGKKTRIMLQYSPPLPPGTKNNIAVPRRCPVEGFESRPNYWKLETPATSMINSKFTTTFHPMSDTETSKTNPRNQCAVQVGWCVCMREFMHAYAMRRRGERKAEEKWNVCFVSLHSCCCCLMLARIYLPTYHLSSSSSLLHHLLSCILVVNINKTLLLLFFRPS